MWGRRDIRSPKFESREPRSGRRGFTLLEILLAVALIALLAGVLVVGSVNLIGDKALTPEDVFWKAVQQARTTALTTEKELRLSYDPKERNFVLDDGSTPQTLPIPATASKDLTVDFLASAKGGSTVLIGGSLVDTHTIKYVTFYTDGTCSPFRIQFRSGGPVRLLDIDPWTCAKVLPKVEGSF